jgi:hypothetical protein
VRAREAVTIAWGVAEVFCGTVFEAIAEDVMGVDRVGPSSMQELIRISSSHRRPWTLKTSSCLLNCSIKVVQYMSWSVSLLVGTGIDISND